MSRLLLVGLLSLGLGNCAGPSRPRRSTTYAPPRILLVSRAGTQEAVAGSSCVHSAGGGRCADSSYPSPARLSVVRPGEPVQIRVQGATKLSVDVHRLGCERRSLRRISLRPDGRWRVDLRPGLYDLQVFSRFASTGKSGDASGGLGLWVDRSHRLDLVPAKSVYTQGCR